MNFALLIFIQFVSFSAFAEIPQLKIALPEAEHEALKHSNLLNSFSSDQEAAVFKSKSQAANLFPRLSFEGTYQYNTSVPEISLPNFPPIRLGSNSMYSIGPVLRYALWDSFSSRKLFNSLSKLADAKIEDLKNAEIQLVLNTRLSYVQVQLELEELRLINDTLILARAQDNDISIRFKSGAASRLDRVTSQRTVLSYQLQFHQKQASLSIAFLDLLALIGMQENLPMPNADFSHPGPPNVEQVSLILQFDSLTEAVSQEVTKEILAPNENHPQLRRLQLQAESSDLDALSQSAKLYPAIQLSAKTSLDYPNGPVLEQIHQNTFMVSVSLPLYLGDPTWHLASEKRVEADAARYREEQMRSDINRDFRKAKEQLNSLREQRDLAARDVEMSQEISRLHYRSYQAGKSNILDVQTANNLAFQSRVNAARLDAQILSQIDVLKALSGKEFRHD